jgi:hypothetical protein
MKYRKKPIEIEAIQFLPTNVQEVAAWCGASIGDQKTGANSLYVHTLEGIMKATYGDYIIKGIKGEFYPCRADIFEASYDQADE